MKPRHAAALALVGWYLLAPVPPAKDRGYWGRLQDLIFGTSEHAPVSQWNQLGVFDTAEKCHAAETEQVNAALESFGQTLEEKGKSKAEIVYDAIIKGGDDSVCIASDDPRLKEK